MKRRNGALIYNILPPHVAAYFLSTARHHDDLYSQSYAEVGVLFASMPNFADFYTEESINNQGLECLRFLNEVISDFDAVSEMLLTYSKSTFWKVIYFFLSTWEVLFDKHSRHHLKSTFGKLLSTSLEKYFVNGALSKSPQKCFSKSVFRNTLNVSWTYYIPNTSGNTKKVLLIEYQLKRLSKSLKYFSLFFTV